MGVPDIRLALDVANLDGGAYGPEVNPALHSVVARFVSSF